jgi:hypothetical protein
MQGLILKDNAWALNRRTNMNDYGFMNCPHCGSETTVDPALVRDEDPMEYCQECDKPLFGNDDARLLPCKEEVSIDELDDMCAKACRDIIRKQNAKQFKALLNWHEEKRALELRIKDLEAEIERLKEGK